MLVLVYLLLFLALCAVLTCFRVTGYNSNYRLVPQRAERSERVPPRQ